jgi:hypothetical protein
MAAVEISEQQQWPEEDISLQSQRRRFESCGEEINFQAQRDRHRIVYRVNRLSGLFAQFLNRPWRLITSGSAGTLITGISTMQIEKTPGNETTRVIDQLLNTREVSRPSRPRISLPSPTSRYRVA